MRDPGVAEGGEVGVVAEDLLRSDVRRQLNEQALVADPHVERVEGLALVEVLRRDEALARRRHAEVDERVGELGRAEAALQGGHQRPPAETLAAVC